MKHKLSFLLLYGVLVLFGGLGALLLLYGEKEAHASLTENRMLAGFPALSVTAVKDGSFMSGLEDYLSDNMFDRDRIVSAVSRLADRFSLAEVTEAEVDEALFEQVQAFAQGSEADPAPDQEPLPADPEQTSPAEEPQTETVLPTEPPAQAEATDAADPAPQADAAPAAQVNAPAEKDLSTVPDCVFTCTSKDGKERQIYQFSSYNVKRMIRLLNRFRAALPEDGHMFFTQPPFPGIANYLSSGEYVRWDSDLEATINAYANDGVYMLSTLEVLQQHLLDGEYLYFKTDHHWTPRAACYVANAFLEKLGIDPQPYDEYDFITYNNFFGSAYSSRPASSKMNPDTIEVLIPETPVKGYIVKWDRSRRDAPLIYPTRSSYYAYLGGTQGPWRRFDTGVDCGRSCLVIGDSYDCVFIPFLTPYYETVHATDIRDVYYDYLGVRWSISEYIAENGIDDVYFVFSTASGVNTDSSVYYLNKFL